MQNIKQRIFLSFLTFAFWGVLYPQFSLVEESYEYVETYEILEGNEKKVQKNEEYVKKQKKKNPREDFIAILNAEAGELQFRSKLWELWKERAKKEN